MTESQRGPQQSMWIAAVGVFVAVLVAAGLGYLIGSSGDSTETATSTTTTTTTTTAASSTPATVAPASSSSTSTSTSTTTTTTTTIPLVTIEATHPDAGVIADTYERFAGPINAGTAALAFETLGPAITRDNTPAAWASGQETSLLHEFTIHEVVEIDPDTRDVRITFRSTQDGEFGRLPGETCTLWDITHRLVRSTPDPAPIWLINRSRQNDGSPQAC